MSKILFLILISNTCFAHEVLWKYQDRFVPLFNNKEKNLLYSLSCSKKKCDALRLSNQIEWSNLSKTALEGGKNPGAVYCKEVLNMNIVYLKDLRGNENSFCLFKDFSLISTNSISVLGNQNSKGHK